MVQYKTGNLFSAEGPNTVLVHACNCKGSWGAGVAKEFARRYPKAHRSYQNLCANHGKNLLGMGFFNVQADGSEQGIGMLFTSNGYGQGKDSEEQILKNTKKAVKCLLSLHFRDKEIHSPKINAGLFGVPWEKTEKIINDCLINYPDVKWVVWEKS